MPLKVTLDTNCFFEYFERDPHSIKQLLYHANKGHVELAMTTRVMSDTHDKWKSEGESPTWSKIQSLPLINTIGTSFRVDTSYLGSDDYLISEEDGKIIGDLHEMLEGAQIEDVDHIFGHLRDNRDIFVTNDSHFLSHHEELKSKFSVVVLKPDDAVKEIERKFPV
jgi:hypothetical protein